MANSDLSKEAFVPIPPIPQDVVGYLNIVFPERSPEITDSINEIYFKAGQRSVVRFLIRLFEDQNDNKLTR